MTIAYLFAHKMHQSSQSEPAQADRQSAGFEKALK